MRQPADNLLQTVLAALPDDRLAALVLELARASNPPAALSSSSPATATAIDDPHRAAMADARRTRKNQARSARRAAARQAKAGGFEKPSAMETAATSKPTNGAAAASAQAPQQPKRPQGWPKGRKRGPRKLATSQPVQARTGNKAGNGAHAGAPAAATTPSTASTPAARLWARAATLAPTTPWRVVARKFGTNEAQAQDAHRTGTLPPGIAPAAIERFLELPTA